MKIAVITMVFNEPVFLPIWLNYYGARLGYENLFIIDDGSSDLSTSDIRIINLIKKPRGLLDEDDRAKLVSCFHEELLRFYDVVIYTDVDELIVVDPIVGSSLNEYLSAGEFEFKNPIGFNVLHRVKTEPKIDLNKSLFEQRMFVQFNLMYSKPLISKIPINWVAGFHSSQYKPRYDTKLLLFHLRAMDIDISRLKIRTLNSVSFSENSLRKDHAFHFRLMERDYLKMLFSTEEVEFENAKDIDSFLVDLGRAVNKKTIHIPDRFRDVIDLNKRSRGFALTGVPSDGHLITGRQLEEKAVTELFSNSMRRVILEGRHRGRNELCPCGSQKRFKHCHGRLV